MSSTRNKPGKSARDIADKFFFKRPVIVIACILVVFLCFFVFNSLLGILSPQSIYITKLAMKIIIIIFVFYLLIIAMAIIKKITESKMDMYEKKEKKALRGAVAEETIADILSQIDGTYAVFHDVDTGYGDIDHIVLSKEHGVILIETKSHHGNVTVRDGKILINGKDPEKNFIAQTFNNTMWLKDGIKEKTGIEPWINSIIVFTNAFVNEEPPVKWIDICNKKFLLNTIGKKWADSSMSRLWALHEQGFSLW